MCVQFSNELDEPRKVFAGRVLAAELLHELGSEKGVEKLVLRAAIPVVVVDGHGIGRATAWQGQCMPRRDRRGSGGRLKKGSDRWEGDEEKDANGEEEWWSHTWGGEVKHQISFFMDVGADGTGSLQEDMEGAVSVVTCQCLPWPSRRQSRI